MTTEQKRAQMQEIQAAVPEDQTVARHPHRRRKKHFSDPEMPYERFLRCGGSVLTDAELIAIILRSGTEKAPVMTIARSVLEAGDHTGHNLTSLYHLTLQDLMAIDGIGQVQGVKLLCILELSRRLSEQKCRPEVIYSSPSAVAECYMESMRHLENERVLLLCLDNRLGFLCDCVLSDGTVNASLVSPRNVFQEAMRHNAVNIMLMHNHPSGDPTPSQEDCDMTRRLHRLGQELDIPIVDHIIIGDRRYYSMKEQGFL